MSNHEELRKKITTSFHHMHPGRWSITTTFTIIVIILIVGGLYGYMRFYRINNQINVLSEKITALENNLSLSTQTLQGTIAEKSTNLEQQLGTYKQQVGTISNTVGTLEKLSKTDPQLLQKYSKVFFLNENYTPARLLEIPNQFKYTESKDIKIHASVWPYLGNMLQAALDANIKIYVSSGYRSFDEQKALKSQYTVVYGAGSANSFSADQGYSEHQLGTTVDLITTGTGGNLEGFDKTPAFTWMNDNAYKYGFIASYPKDNNYYIFEPWHWRFVGIKLATYLHTSNQYFYNLDQREIDQYLVDVFE